MKSIFQFCDKSDLVIKNVASIGNIAMNFWEIVCNIQLSAWQWGAELYKGDVMSPQKV